MLFAFTNPFRAGEEDDGIEVEREVDTETRARAFSTSELSGTPVRLVQIVLLHLLEAAG